MKLINIRAALSAASNDAAAELTRINKSEEQS